MIDKKRLIHIHHCRGIGWKGIKRFVSIDPELKFIDDLTVNRLINDFGFKKSHAENFYHDLHTINSDKKVSDYANDGIHMITLDDVNYPQHLKAIYDPPWVLYVKGNVQLLHRRLMLSVVGTRKPTRDGLTAMNLILQPLIDKSWTIVSGMALGIDGAAHQLALRSSTIAVLGSGLYHPYPKKHIALFNKMTNDHLVMSEYPPEQPPRQWQFPERNRIISGLSLGTLVVEAREQSGSLITADQALEQGREVFALPGNIFNENTRGTHRLIQQGAQLVTSADDIIDILMGVNLL